MRRRALLFISLVLISVVSAYAQSITQQTITSAGQSLSSSGISLNFTVGELSINHLKGPSVSLETGLFGKVEEEGITLPVTLVDFRLAVQRSTVRLFWTVQQEYNTSHYELLKSTDGINFLSAGKVIALGGTSLQRHYDFTDNTFQRRSYYKLKIVDMDGQYKLSNVLSAIPDGAGARIAVFPNPIRSFVNININVNPAGVASVYIRNASGTAVISQYYILGVGQNTVSINTNSLPSGIYFVSVQTKDWENKVPIIKL